MEEKNVCGLCQGGCHIITDIEDGRLVGVRADKDSPLGRLCPRGAIAPQILYGEQRNRRRSAGDDRPHQGCAGTRCEGNCGRPPSKRRG
ncbi:MAG: hypothetical protein ACI4B9_03735 [Eggerthellaceae bacterium]